MGRICTSVLSILFHTGPSVSTDCKPQVDKVILEDDLNTVSQISDLCSQLVTPHEVFMIVRFIDDMLVYSVSLNVVLYA